MSSPKRLRNTIMTHELSPYVFVGIFLNISCGGKKKPYTYIEKEKLIITKVNEIDATNQL